jgi:hypothetical protein
MEPASLPAVAAWLSESQAAPSFEPIGRSTGYGLSRTIQRPQPTDWRFHCPVRRCSRGRFGPGEPGRNGTRHFGRAIALDGNTLLIGDPRASTKGPNTGKARSSSASERQGHVRRPRKVVPTITTRRVHRSRCRAIPPCRHPQRQAGSFSGSPERPGSEPPPSLLRRGLRIRVQRRHQVDSELIAHACGDRCGNHPSVALRRAARSPPSSATPRARSGLWRELLQPQGRAAGNAFGSAVAFTDFFLAAGSPLEDIGGIDRGTVTLFAGEPAPDWNLRNVVNGATPIQPSAPTIAATRT